MKLRVCFPALLLSGLFCLIPSLLYAQEDRVTRVGFALNGIAYLGDLNEPGLGLRRVSAGGELSIESWKPSVFGVSFHAGFGQFTEQWDNPDNQPGTRFVQTPYLHGDFRVHARALPQKAFQPFASVGGGLLSFTPKDVDGFPLEEGNYNTIIPQFPFTAGARWEVNQMIGFELSYTWRFTPTDFLDNIGSEGSRSGFDAIHAINLGLTIDLGEDLPDDPNHRPGPESTPNPVPIAQELMEEPVVEDQVPNIQEETIVNEEEYDRDAALRSIEEELFLYYETKSGETIEGLAKRFRVPPDILYDLNILHPDQKLKKGTYLKIPHVSEP